MSKFMLAGLNDDELKYLAAAAVSRAHLFNDDRYNKRCLMGHSTWVEKEMPGLIEQQERWIDIAELLYPGSWTSKHTLRERFQSEGSSNDE